MTFISPIFYFQNVCEVLNPPMSVLISIDGLQIFFITLSIQGIKFANICKNKVVANIFKSQYIFFGKKNHTVDQLAMNNSKLKWDFMQKKILRKVYLFSSECLKFLNLYHGHLKMSLCVRKPTIWVHTRSDTNQAVQSQKKVRGWKFWI